MCSNLIKDYFLDDQRWFLLILIFNKLKIGGFLGDKGFLKYCSS